MNENQMAVMQTGGLAVHLVMVALYLLGKMPCEEFVKASALVTVGMCLVTLVWVRSFRNHR